MGVAEKTPDNWTLWFFPCLFLTAVASLGLIRAVGPATSISLSLALATLLMIAAPLPVRLPWSADAAVVASVFFQVGLLLGATNLVPKGEAALPHRFWSVGLASLAFAGVVLVARVNGRVDLANLVFGNPALWIVGATLGTAGIVAISLVLPSNLALQRLSEDSRVIFPLHTLVFGFLTGVLTVLLHVDRATLKDSNTAVAD
jgi:acyltransferase